MYLPQEKSKMPLFIAGGLIILAGVLWSYLANILTPFIVGLIAAYLFNRPTTSLATKMPRSLASFLIVLIVILVIVLFLSVIVPLLIYQLSDLTGKTSAILNWLKATFENTFINRWLNAHINMNDLFSWENFKHLSLENSDTIKNMLLQVSNYAWLAGGNLLFIVFNLFMTPLAFYYFLHTWPDLVESIKRMIPRRYLKGTMSFMRDLDSALIGYLHGQFLVMLVMGLIYGFGLFFIGLNNGFAIGFMTGFLVFVPYLGFTVGSIFATLAAILQFGDVTHIGEVWLVFLIGQTLETYWVTPKLIGDRIGLSPIVVIFALLAFSVLFGFVGMVLALPLSAILVVTFKALLTKYYHSDYYLNRRG